MRITLFYILFFSPIISILAFFVFFKRNISRLKWIIFLLISIGFFIDYLCIALGNKNISNVWIVNVYTLLESLFLFSFFYFLFASKLLFQRITLLLSTLLVIIWVTTNFIVGNIHTYDSISQASEFIILFFLCLLYYFQKAKVVDEYFVYSYYEFWIVSALLMYCAGTFFSFFVPTSITNKRTPDTLAFEYISRLGGILKNILIAIAFCMQNKPPSSNLVKANSMYTIKY